MARLRTGPRRLGSDPVPEIGEFDGVEESQGCIASPAGPVGGDDLGSEAGVMPGLADLIATAGLATDDPYEGSGPAPGWGSAAHEWEPLPGSAALGPWPLGCCLLRSRS